MQGISPDADDGSSIDARPCTGGTTAQVGPDGSCFVFVATLTTNAVARSSCAAMAGHLAYLKNPMLDTFGQQLVGTTDTWIGGSDRDTEGSFFWDDKTPFEYTNWHTGEPNAGGAGATYQEDCVIIAGGRVDKQWDDRPCDDVEVPSSGNFAYLCQY